MAKHTDIRLINTDATEWARKQKPKSIDHIITDHPYGVYFPLDEFERITRGHIITFCDPKRRPFELRTQDEVLFWVKPTSTKNYIKHMGRFVEEILVRRGDGAAFNMLYWANMTGVFTDFPLIRNEHEYQKPLTLMERLVLIYTTPGELILDPYVGSGTTLEACAINGRRSIGIDIKPEWIEYSKKRLEKFK